MSVKYHKLIVIAVVILGLSFVPASKAATDTGSSGTKSIDDLLQETQKNIKDTESIYRDIDEINNDIFDLNLEKSQLNDLNQRLDQQLKLVKEKQKLVQKQIRLWREQEKLTKQNETLKNLAGIGSAQDIVAIDQSASVASPSTGPAAIPDVNSTGTRPALTKGETKTDPDWLASAHILEGGFATTSFAGLTGSPLDERLGQVYEALALSGLPGQRISDRLALILAQGLDNDQLRYVRPLSGAATAADSPIYGSAEKVIDQGAAFILVSAPNVPLSQGVKYVIVTDLYTPLLPQLTAAYPGLSSLRPEQVNAVLTEGISR